MKYFNAIVLGKNIGYLILIGLSFFVIRFLTIYTLMFGIYGTSSRGSELAEDAYEQIWVKHFPLLFIFFILGLRWIIKRRQRNKRFEILGLAVASTALYIIIEITEILIQ